MVSLHRSIYFLLFHHGEEMPCTFVCSLHQNATAITIGFKHNNPSPDPRKTHARHQYSKAWWGSSLIYWRGGDDDAGGRASISRCYGKGLDPWQKKRPLGGEWLDVFMKLGPTAIKTVITMSMIVLQAITLALSPDICRGSNLICAIRGW